MVTYVRTYYKLISCRPFRQWYEYLHLHGVCIGITTTLSIKHTHSSRNRQQEICGISVHSCRSTAVVVAALLQCIDRLLYNKHRILFLCYVVPWNNESAKYVTRVLRYATDSSAWYSIQRHIHTCYTYVPTRTGIRYVPFPLRVPVVPEQDIYIYIYIDCFSTPYC